VKYLIPHWKGEKLVYSF